jgi:hypothetical protein
VKQVKKTAEKTAEKSRYSTDYSVPCGSLEPALDSGSGLDLLDFCQAPPQDRKIAP